MKKKILFVCHGNICRSPMAEYILKYLTKEKYIIESRAISREEIGNDMHNGTKQQLNIHNIPYQRHYAKQINKNDYNNFDYIICFDDYNLRNLENMFGPNPKIKKLLSANIDDPWYTGNFDKTYQDIYKGCLYLLNQLEEKN